MGQTARNRFNPAGRSRGGLPLLAVALIASTMVTGCGSSLAAATTTLAGVTDARVVHSDGTVVGAIDGLRLHRGDVVRTGPAGRAELHTRGRVVYEGSDAAVQVLDGARSDLRHGAVVVDAQHGPGLSLTIAGLQVSAGSGTALRAERSVTVRVAALDGDVPVDSVTGRHVVVAALTQAVVGGDALPDSTADTPLRLTDDDGEARAVPVLVRDDLALNSLAAGIDGTGGSVVRVVTAAWHSALEALPTGVAGSEQVLPVVIAASSGSDPSARYDEAVKLRRAGASWGVVAHRLHTSSDAVLAALQRFQKGAATGRVGTIPAALAYVAGGSGGGPAGAGGAPGSTSRSGGGGSSAGGPKPSPSPSGSTDPVGGTIDKVLKLLPTPVPTSTSVLPVTAPSVDTSVPALPAGSLLTPAPALLPSH
jgi:uncharacterized membrane protein YgcG